MTIGVPKGLYGLELIGTQRFMWFRVDRHEATFRPPQVPKGLCTKILLNVDDFDLMRQVPFVFFILKVFDFLL